MPSGNCMACPVSEAIHLGISIASATTLVSIHQGILLGVQGIWVWMVGGMPRRDGTMLTRAYAKTIKALA